MFGLPSQDMQLNPQVLKTLTLPLTFMMTMQ